MILLFGSVVIIANSSIDECNCEEHSDICWCDQYVEISCCDQYIPNDEC